MKKQLFKIVVLLIPCLLLFNNCIAEPEDPPPPLMEWLVGTYNNTEAYSASTYSRIETDSSSNLIINADYTYSLFFKGYSNRMDSTLVISQIGAFNIDSTKWVDEKNTWNFKHYEGTIWFYPENENRWGSGFIVYHKNSLIFSGYAKLVTKDGVEIEFVNWGYIY